MYRLRPLPLGRSLPTFRGSAEDRRVGFQMCDPTDAPKRQTVVLSHELIGYRKMLSKDLVHRILVTHGTPDLFKLRRLLHKPLAAWSATEGENPDCPGARHGEPIGRPEAIMAAAQDSVSQLPCHVVLGFLAYAYTRLEDLGSPPSEIWLSAAPGQAETYPTHRSLFKEPCPLERFLRFGSTRLSKAAAPLDAVPKDEKHKNSRDSSSSLFTYSKGFLRRSDDTATLNACLPATSRRHETRNGARSGTRQGYWSSVCSWVSSPTSTKYRPYAFPVFSQASSSSAGQKQRVCSQINDGRKCTAASANRKSYFPVTSLA
ncbi:hypothetical protein CCMA1212_010249 [Trichoderma ghanense]|uniref:Uncharacterized protein n=1 Tax=Trichoderma ghanense TaxID=65468 RepID=A0ABY2GQ83_9HYPO